MTSKKPGQFRLHLSPLHSGSFTRWRLSGSVPTAMPGRELGRVIRTLWFWSGWPIELVLPVAAETACWFEYWSDAIAEIPEDRLVLRLMTKRAEADHGQPPSR
ncbi:MAG: hypothetical protein V1750_02330 [Acidobacteriota bacterium]